MTVSASVKFGIKALLGLLLTTTAVLGGANTSKPSTAPYVDLSRYGGRWYTIASLPAWFEKGCTGSTTDYTLVKDRELKVVNSCHKGSLDGPIKRFEGKAWVVEPRSNSKLKVKFGWFVTRDFWIFEVTADYQHAVIGTPDGDYMWILSRTPSMDKSAYRNMVARAAEKGLDTSRLRKIVQPGSRQAADELRRR